MVRLSPRLLLSILLAVLTTGFLVLTGCVDTGQPLGPGGANSLLDNAAAGAADGIEAAIESEDDNAVVGLADATPITGPTEITKPGRYRVTRDFAVSTGDGITIRANRVVLSLGGHLITGPGNKTGRGVVVEGARHVLVTNGTLKSFGMGVVFLGTSRSAIKRIEVLGGDETADPANGNPPQIGLMLVNSSKNRLRRNHLELVNLGIFVRGGDSYDNTIRRNRVRAGMHGLLAICYNPAMGEGRAGPHDDEVADNRLLRFDTGIQTSIGSEHNRFASNKIEYFTAAWDDLNGSNAFTHNRTRQITP